MVLDVVEISRTGLISADKSENIDPVDEESALLDKDDGAEVHKTIRCGGSNWISFSVFIFGHNFKSDGLDYEQLTYFGSRLHSVECPMNAHLEHVN
ncbi:UNVERIFIED_CONTAM: hypothetical protein NCL1_61050 [Trichonephila clavipes]